MKSNNTVVNLLKSAPVLSQDDTIRRAAGLIRVSEGSAVFVRGDNALSGLVTEQAISAFIGANSDSDTTLDSSIGKLVSENTEVLHPSYTIKAAAEAFGRSESDVLPVVDAEGVFYGAVYRSDIICYLTNNLRPTSVGGMATPLGVFLTTGAHNGGAGSMGLFLTGVSLRFMITLAAILVYGLMEGLRHLTGVRLDVMLASTPVSDIFNIYDLPFYISTVLSVILFLVLLRLSPLSGYHAAEHMTVHAIERGETLTPEVVSQMPRVHPRCGSNILAIAGIFLIISSAVGAEIAVLLGVLVIVLGWRKIGGWLQQAVTTSVPNKKQLLSGIAAGKEIMDKYQENPAYQVQGFQRLLNMGFLQTLLGMFVAQILIWSIISYFNIGIWI